LNVASEPDSVGFGTHGFNAEGDVFFERDGEFFRAFNHIFAIYPPRKGFVLHAFLYRTGLQIQNAFGRADVRAGGNETGEFVAGKESFLELGIARHARVIRVRKNRADDFFWIALLAKNLCAF